jgi:uncharacterized Tic20 family protein
MSDTNTPEISTEVTEVMGMKSDTYCMLLHLSQLLSLFTAIGGIIVPIVMWAIAKDKSPLVDQHGKIVLNWIISVVIYGVAAVLLCLVFVGFLLIPVLVVLAIVFPIIGAVKANEGVVWRYPFSIPFFK